jgi:uncharacterized protein YbjT (DUF2867 family)
MIKNMHILGSNYSGDDKLVLSHPKDVAAAIAEELQSAGNGIKVKYIVSEALTGNEVAAILGNAIGEPNLPWVEFPDEQFKQGMLSVGLPPELADLLTEMGQGIRAGIMTKDFFETKSEITGKIMFKQFAEEFKSRYQQV